MPDQLAEIFQPQTAALIRKKAAQLAFLVRPATHDREDFEQDLALELLKRLPRFDSRLLSREAFDRMIVRRATANILRHHQAARRDDRAVLALAARPDWAAETGWGTEFMRDRSLLAQDLHDLQAKLPPDLHALAERLKFQSLSEAARSLGLPRSTLYERFQALKRWLKALDDSLSPSSATASEHEDSAILSKNRPALRERTG